MRLSPSTRAWAAILADCALSDRPRLACLRVDTRPADNGASIGWNRAKAERELRARIKEARDYEREEMAARYHTRTLERFRSLLTADELARAPGGAEHWLYEICHGDPARAVYFLRNHLAAARGERK